MVRSCLAPAATADLVYSGRTLGPRDATAIGLVDGVADPDELLETALVRARELSRIPRETFAVTKGQLRRPALERVAADATESAAEIERIWTDARTREHIADYMERTVRKKA